MKQDSMLLAIPSMGAARKVAVVGNGGNLLEKEQGELIDSYDVVIRMNSFDINEKFVKHTGKKTTIWSNAMHYRVPYKDDNEYGQMICPLALNDPKYFVKYGATSKEMFAAYKNKAIFMPSDYFAELLSLIGNPSTGISTLFWLKKDEIPFDIFGFTFFNNKYPHHYHDDWTGCGHHGNNEEKFFYKYLT